MEREIKMEIKEITSEEYKSLTLDSAPVFCTREFLELNRPKVDNVHYLVVKDKKNRLAFAIGEKDGIWKAPYSAPFSTIIMLQKSVDLEYYWEFINQLNKYAKNKGAKQINIFLAPDIYGSQNNAKILNALLGNGYKIEFQELNFSINLNDINLEDYKASIHRNARKNLNIALNSELELYKCETIDDKKDAYNVISINRASKGYPLRMTLEQVMDTIELVKHDFFLVKHAGEAIAAAVIFYVNDKIVQVIYWGDIPNVGEYKPINFLSYKLIEYYKDRGILHIDIGPSTENGVPNFGLCNFKESIGCEVSSKYKFSIDI